MSHPMSEFSNRSHNLFRQGIPHTPGPFTPEDLPHIQYEMHGETTVDQRATEMLRKPTEAEVKQLGSEYRSDLGPHNYRVSTFFIPDSQPSGLIDIQTDFQVWSIATWQYGVFIAGSFSPPSGYGRIMPYGIGFNNGPLNLPTGQKMQIEWAAPAVPADGTGYNIWLYDRWVPN